jgi:hypothetical protein
VTRLGAVTRLAAVVALLGAAAACSTGGSGAGDLGSGTQPADNSALCGLVAQLPDAAAALERADVRDPATFTTTLNTAVQQYVATLDQISKRADSKLRGTVTEVRRLVLAHQFSAATAARVPLDTWTADHC